MSQPEVRVRSRTEPGFVRSVLKSLRHQQRRFWRGPGMVVWVICLCDALVQCLFWLFLRQQGGTIQFGPGLPTPSYLGVSFVHWNFMGHALSGFLVPAISAFAWCALAMPAARRVAAVFEDAAAPGLELSASARFQCASLAAWPALLPMAVSQFLVSIVITFLSSHFVADWRVVLYPVSVILLILPLALALLFITAVWLLNQKLAVLLLVLLLMPDSNFWRSALQMFGPASIPMTQLPTEAIDSFLPGAQLYGLIVLVLAILLLVRGKTVLAMLPLSLIAASFFVSKATSDFLHLPILLGTAAKSTLYSAQVSQIFAFLKGIIQALGVILYKINGTLSPGGFASFQLTSFELLVFPVPFWIGILLYAMLPLHGWAFYLLLRGLLSLEKRLS